jgi:HNH endonuclease
MIIDHIISMSNGGSNDISNLQLSVVPAAAKRKIILMRGSIGGLFEYNNFSKYCKY